MIRALLVALAMCGTAAASPVRLQIASDGCDLDALEAQLATLVGRDPIDPNAHAGVRVEVTGTEARIWFDDGGAVRGPRVVAAKACTELVASVALVIAMALPDLPDATAPVVDAPPPTVAPPTRRETAADSLELAALAAAPQRERRPIELDVFAVGAGGIASDRAEGELVLGVRARRGAVSLGAEVRADLPHDVQLDRMGRVDVVRAEASLSPCMHFGAVAGCALVSVGTFHGDGVGLTSARGVFAPLVAAGLRATWEHPIARGFAFRLQLDVDSLLTTTQFDVDDMEAWVSPRFEASLGLGVLAHFP